MTLTSGFLLALGLLRGIKRITSLWIDDAPSQEDQVVLHQQAGRPAPSTAWPMWRISASPSAFSPGPLRSGKPGGRPQAREALSHAELRTLRNQKPLQTNQSGPLGRAQCCKLSLIASHSRQLLAALGVSISVADVKPGFIRS